MTFLLVCGGFFAGLLVASWLTSAELDAANKRADDMEALCQRAYDAMREGPDMPAPRFRSVEAIEAERLIRETGGRV